MLIKIFDIFLNDLDFVAYFFPTDQRTKTQKIKLSLFYKELIFILESRSQMSYMIPFIKGKISYKGKNSSGLSESLRFSNFSKQSYLEIGWLI